MTEATLLLRHVHPSWVQEGRPTSQTFKPTPKDNGKLSAYDGDMIEPKQSWTHYTSVLKLTSVGVLALTVGEFQGEQLPAAADPEAFAEHVLVDYSAHASGQIEKKSKKLKAIAVARGWQYLAEAS